MSSTSLELPLFPLNVVFFPGTVLPLHIFEPRYRQMIAECLEEEKPFGVVLVRPESELLQEEVYPVGTMARIHQVDHLEDGRYNLIAVGIQRFRIVREPREKAYLSAVVEPLDDEHDVNSDLSGYAEQALELFGSYLEVLLESANKSEITAHLPEGARELSYLIGYLLDAPDEQKQRLLELTSTRQRLEEEIAILRHEVPFVKQMLLRSDRFFERPDKNILN